MWMWPYSKTEREIGEEGGEVRYKVRSSQDRDRLSSEGLICING